MTEPDHGAETLDVPTAQEAVLTVMRLFRALERVDTGLTAQQYRILKRADAAYADWLGPLLGATGDTAGVLEALRGLDAAMEERRRARKGVA